MSNISRRTIPAAWQKSNLGTGRRNLSATDEWRDLSHLLSQSRQRQDFTRNRRRWLTGVAEWSRVSTKWRSRISSWHRGTKKNPSVWYWGINLQKMVAHFKANPNSSPQAQNRKKIKSSHVHYSAEYEIWGSLSAPTQNLLNIGKYYFLIVIIENSGHSVNDDRNLFL